MALDTSAHLDPEFDEDTGFADATADRTLTAARSHDPQSRTGRPRAGRPRADQPHADHSRADRPRPGSDAEALCRDAEADPRSPLLGVVLGAGGTGKTALLDTLAGIYDRAGVLTCRDPRALPEPSAGIVTVLVDDARELDDVTLGRLRRLSAGGRVGVVIAHRPGPARRELAALVATLGRARPPVVLAALDRDEVAARTRAALRADAAVRTDGGSTADVCTADLVEHLFEQTGGIPRLLDLLLGAMVEAGGQPHAIAAGAAKLPESVLEALRADLDLLDPPVLGLLRALTVGAPMDPDVMADLLDVDAAAVADAVETARGTGLLGEHGRLVPLARRAVLALTPAMLLTSLRRRLAAATLRHGGPVLPVALELMDTATTGADVVAVLVAAAGATDCAQLAGRLYAEAVAAGAPAVSLAARRAEAAALAGDADAALRLADSVISAGRPTGKTGAGAGVRAGEGDRGRVEAAERDRAVAVAAAVLAQRGLLDRSAALYRALTADGSPPSPLAVPALVGTGHLDDARAVLAAGRDAASGALGLADGAETLVAEGVLDTVDDSPSTALSKLTRAAVLLEPRAATVLMADTPAALAALVALNCGEFAVAESVLRRAVSVGLGGPGARARHRLLQAWTAMQQGNLGAAREHVRAAGTTLEPREELLAVAIEVGLARREGDIAALTGSWARARAAIVRHPVDLYALHSLGELAVAAARLGEQRWITPHLTEAWQLLDRLGGPDLWAAPLHWYAVQAATLAERPADADAHVAALSEAAARSPQAAALATAATCWIKVMGGEIDQAQVESAARRLQAVGHGWDAARLAGQAAIRAEERTVMSALMACARSLRPAAPETAASPAPGSAASPAPGSAASPAPGSAASPAPKASPASAASPTTAARSTTASPSPIGASSTPGAPSTSGPSVTSVAGGQAGTVVQLSDREREVAALLVSGLTYKQIGARLFISAKTVEHHVARMRHRLGASDRGELFALLRRASGQR